MSETAKGKLSRWLKSYTELLNRSQIHRCKVVGIERNQDGKNILLVAINTIKSPLPIEYLPEELVVQNEMLREFSQEDVRAITFCAIKNAEKLSNQTKEKIFIKKQEFHDNQTVYVLQSADTSWEIRKTARELYSDSLLLSCFDLKDIINIVSTAVQEQLINDFGN
ncbi:MAG: hypothetical protein EPO11_09895 [Gammaproteobacteria bacterium]|nr:MAG: hypothetical protein EPO11_09895 [Gammaproteobacteria bacterium]